MCQALNALIADGRSEGRTEGQTEEMLRIIRKMAEKGLEVLDTTPFFERALK